MARTKSNTAAAQSSATIGFEAKLWLTADKLRNNMDAAEYKHVVLGLIFLKYISDTFEEHRAKLLAGQGEYAGANAEDPDEYKAENVFWHNRRPDIVVFVNGLPLGLLELKNAADEDATIWSAYAQLQTARHGMPG